MKSVKGMGGPNVVAAAVGGSPKTERGLIDHAVFRENGKGLSIASGFAR